MSAVLVHLPSGFPRVLRANDWTPRSQSPRRLSSWGYRVWEALLNKLCDPDCRSVAARFHINKDTAARALRSLADCGLLLRERRSAGRRVFAWCYLITDEPWAWLNDAALAEKFDRAHDAEVERLRSYADTALDTLPPVPQPAADPQATSCPTTADIPNKDSRREDSPPTPSPVDRVVHRPSRFERRLADLLHSDPQLQPQIPDALALLHGLGFPPLGRVRHARTVALGLRSGLRLDELTTYLTREMATARNRQAVMGHRLARLAAELDRHLTAPSTDIPRQPRPTHPLSQC